MSSMVLYSWGRESQSYNVFIQQLFCGTDKTYCTEHWYMLRMYQWLSDEIRVHGRVCILIFIWYWYWATEHQHQCNWLAGDSFTHWGKGNTLKSKMFLNLKIDNMMIIMNGNQMKVERLFSKLLTVCVFGEKSEFW